jgi:membrane protease YdiL (CAAX protease family)
MSVGRVRRQSASQWLSVLLTTIALGWALVPGQAHGLWANTAIAAAIGVLAALSSAGELLRAQRSPSTCSVLRGVLAGVVMALATHALYPMAVSLLPAIGSEAEVLYSRLDGPPGRFAALPIVALVVAAEELVWRGIAYSWLEQRLGRALAVLCATVIYALPQLASGSWLLPVLALGCGAIWTLQRALSGTLLLPYATHLTWSLLVMVLFPLAPA